MKNLLIVLGILLVSSCASTDPVARYTKAHESKSWGYYQDNWKDVEIEQAKAVREQEKARVKDSIDLVNHKAKIARIKRL